MSQTTRFVSGIALNIGLIVVACASAGCAGKAPGHPQGALQNGNAQPAVVATIRPTREDLQRLSDSAPAELMPYEQTEITAKVPGYVQKINVDIGDRVRGPRYGPDGRLSAEGEVLAELWVPEMIEELKQKEELIKQANADVKQATANAAATAANLRTAEAALKEAQAGRGRAKAMVKRWGSEYQRLRRLSQGVIDVTTVEEAEYQYEAAMTASAEIEAKIQSMQAARDESAAKRDKAEADVAAAQAGVGVAVANRDQARAMLGYAKLTAPYDGVVTKRNVHTGAYINDKTGQQPLLTLMRTDKLRVAIDVSEKDVRFLNPDNLVHVDLDAFPGKKITWKIGRFAPVLGAGKKARLEIHISNPDGVLYPGMYGHAVVTLEEKKAALTIPSTCLNNDDKGLFVYTVIDGKAAPQRVTIGINDGRKVEIITGLSGGEDLIAGGKDLVRPGQAVAVGTSDRGK
jgi:RND family efflux transporter MFP subunit